MDRNLTMKKFLLAAFLFLLPTVAWGQCTGLFNPGSVCGNSTAAPAPAGPAALTAILNKGAIIVAVRSSAATTVTVTITDYFLCLDPTSNAITVNLPSSPATGISFLIKDCTGQSAVHNITVNPASGNIDGAGTFILSTAFESIAVTYTGAQWSVN